MTGQRIFPDLSTVELQLQLVETKILLPCSLEPIVHASSYTNVTLVGSVGFQDRQDACPSLLTSKEKIIGTNVRIVQKKVLKFWLKRLFKPSLEFSFDFPSISSVFMLNQLKYCFPRKHPQHADCFYDLNVFFWKMLFGEERFVSSPRKGWIYL